MHDTDTRHRRRATTSTVDIAGLTRVEGEGSLRLRVRDGEVVEAGAPRDLRGAALLRAARRGPDAGRGHRHRRPHLRDLPGRLPDDRGPRLRGRLRHRDRPRRPGAPPPALLRRVDREPRPPRLPPPPARLPRLRERARAGPRPSRCRRVRARAQEGRQPARRARSAAGRSIRSRSGSAASRARSDASEITALRGAADRGARDRPGDGRPGRRPRHARRSSATAASGRAPPPDRIPDERGPDRLDRRHRHRPDRLALDVQRGAGRLVERAPGARPRRRARTCSGRCAADHPRPPTGSIRSRPSALARTGLAAEIAVNPYRSIVARAIELVDATAEALDIIDAYQPPDAPARRLAAGAGQRGVGDRGAARDALPRATSSTTRDSSRTPRSCRRPARTRPPSRPTWPPSRRRSSTCRTSEATHRIEQLIRSYDPCISCATHFLDLTVEGGR